MKMSAEFTPTGDIKEFIEDIILKHKIAPPVDIKYHPGSEIGDGYGSKTLAIDIRNETKSLDLFVKYPLKTQLAEKIPVHKTYANETYFFDTIYPAFKEFLTEKNIEDPFNNVPKCYGTSATHAVALENLRKRNFVLYDKPIPMNDEHLILVLKTFAKFHAISFSFKDQHAEKHEEFAKNTFDFYSKGGEAFGFENQLKASMDDFLKKMDPAKDRHILDACSNIVDDLLKTLLSVDKTLNEYSILTKGDCWVNNMMFLYEDDSKNVPADVMLIDWQVIRPASPVFDIAYFLYANTSKEALSKLTHYLKVYHEELSKQIQQLGSDPNILYPYSVLEKEWKQHGKYGLAMAFLFLKVIFYTKEEKPSFDNMELQEIMDHPELMFPAVKNDIEYICRLKDLVEHFVENSMI